MKGVCPGLLLGSGVPEEQGLPLYSKGLAVLVAGRV